MDIIDLIMVEVNTTVIPFSLLYIVWGAWALAYIPFGLYYGFRIYKKIEKLERRIKESRILKMI